MCRFAAGIAGIVLAATVVGMSIVVIPGACTGIALVDYALTGKLFN